MEQKPLSNDRDDGGGGGGGHDNGNDQLQLVENGVPSTACELGPTVLLLTGQEMTLVFVHLCANTEEKESVAP